MELRRQLRVVRAWIPLLVASVLLAGVAGYVVAGLQAPVYETDTTLAVGESLSGVSPAYDQLLVSQSLASTYASLATTPGVLDRVIRTLGLSSTPEELARRVSAAATSGSTLLTITAQGSDPTDASDLANAVAEELVATSTPGQGAQNGAQQYISSDLTSLRTEISDTQAQIAALNGLASLTATQEATLATLQGRLVTLQSTYVSLLSLSTSNSATTVSIVQPAVTPSAPVSPRKLLTAMLAAMVAFLAVAAIAFMRAQLDDSVSDADQVRETLGLPTLGAIVRMKAASDPSTLLAAVDSPGSPAAEAYRTLRTNVEFAALDRPLRTLLVTSALPSEGKTVTAANLAAAFAQGGRRILLVDADLRHPGVHELFGLKNIRGLTDLIRSDAAHPESAVQRTRQGDLFVLTTGPLVPNPTDALSSGRMQSVVATLAAAFDLLVFDAPPLEVFADSAVLSSAADGTLLVVDASRGRRTSVRRAVEAIDKAKGNLFGVVLNRQSSPVYSAYSGYYGPAADVSAGASAETGRPA